MTQICSRLCESKSFWNISEYTYLPKYLHSLCSGLYLEQKLFDKVTLICNKKEIQAHYTIANLPEYF